MIITSYYFFHVVHISPVKLLAFYEQVLSIVSLNNAR